jgi:tetratricopeptide (TPR) repeat protein
MRHSGRHEDQPRPEKRAVPGSRQVHADQDISGIASTGDHAVNIQNRAAQMVVLPAEAFAPMKDVPAPVGLTNLPVRPGLFVGRAEELRRLDAALAESHGVVVQAVHGLGGIGKSALAAHWAATRAAAHIVTWWITADSPASINAGLAGLATALQPALASVLPPEALRDRAVQWLAAHRGWLVVLDNVTDPADVAPLLARAAVGRFLITSRRATGWHNLVDPIRLDVLDTTEALDLLTQITGAGSAHLTSALELCRELGFLPLAIEQAGAFQAEAGITPRDYLDLLERYPADTYRATTEGGDASRTIARIWHVTLDKLADEPLTGQVLRILAWYAPDNIPRTLLDDLDRPVAVASAVGRLAAYNMITANAEVLAVHRLVQAVARTPEPGDPHRDPRAIETAREQAICRLAATFPDWKNAEQWPGWRAFLPHANALVSHIPPEDDTISTLQLLILVARFANSHSQVTLATNYFERALIDAEKFFGSSHTTTLTCRSNLASVCQTAGDLRQAAHLFEQVIANQEQILGADHPDTLNTRNNLAGTYFAAGDLGRAVPLFEQLLTDQERVSEADYLFTLTVRNNLASAYQAAGNLSRAVPLFEQVLGDRQRVLGPDHPDTLNTRNNLAGAYQAAGDLSQAQRLLKKVIADQERTLGIDHPATLNSRENLAGIYHAAGNLGRATNLFEQILADSERILGSGHPRTLTCRANLASAYSVAGDWNRAVPLLEQVLAEHERVLGEENPRTLACRDGLANAYFGARDLNRAVPLLERVLADYEGVLGKDDPRTLSSCHLLAGAYAAVGDLDRAIPLFEQVLAVREEVLGADHPETLASRRNLALARRGVTTMTLTQTVSSEYITY